MPNNNLTPAAPATSSYTVTYSDGTTKTIDGVAVMAIGDGGYEFYADPASFYGVSADQLKPMETVPAGATLTEIRDSAVDHEQIPAVTELSGAEMPEQRPDGSYVLQTANMTDPFGLMGGAR